MNPINKTDFPASLGFIILFYTEIDPVVKSLYIDRDSGGYLYVSKFDTLRGLRIFKSIDEAEQYINNDSDMIRDCKMSDGTIDPPRLIHSAAGMCNTRIKGQLFINIHELTVGGSLYATNRVVERKIPKGYIY